VDVKPHPIIPHRIWVFCLFFVPLYCGTAGRSGTAPDLGTAGSEGGEAKLGAGRQMCLFRSFDAHFYVREVEWTTSLFMHGAGM
jgi:hypothetical protein